MNNTKPISTIQIIVCLFGMLLTIVSIIAVIFISIGLIIVFSFKTYEKQINEVNIERNEINKITSEENQLLIDLTKEIEYTSGVSIDKS